VWGGGRSGYRTVRGWKEGGMLVQKPGRGGTYIAVQCIFELFHMVQLSKNDGYLFAMENIYHSVFI
jgi:hypothetical protein